MEIDELEQVRILIDKYCFTKIRVASALGVPLSELNSWLNLQVAVNDKAKSIISEFYKMISSFYMMSYVTDNSYKHEQTSSWFDTPFNLGDGYNITPWDIYDNHDFHQAYSFFGQIMIRQQVGISFTDIIDKALPGWETIKDSWYVSTALDGSKSIQHK